jgi:hypothetical protein
MNNEPIIVCGYRLRTYQGVTLIRGQQYPDFRGEMHTITGGMPPHKPSSSGRIYTERGEYFPGVFNAEWVDASAPPVGYTAEELERDNPYNRSPAYV